MRTSIKTLAVTLGILGCLLLASGAMAFNVTSGGSGNFALDGPQTTFTAWALAGGAITYGDFNTYSQTDPTWGYTNYITGTWDANTWVSLDVPFNFNAPVTSAKINFSSICADYGNNWGGAQIFVLDTAGNQTKLFSQCADSTDPNLADYNYTASQTPSAGFFDGYTDFSGVVAGQTSFTIRFTVGTGWNWPLGNGAGFFPYDTRVPSELQDFIFTGTTAVPEPGSLVALASGLCGLMGLAIRRRK